MVRDEVQPGVGSWVLRECSLKEHSGAKKGVDFIRQGNAPPHIISLVYLSECKFRSR